MIVRPKDKEIVLHLTFGLRYKDAKELNKLNSWESRLRSELHDMEVSGYNEDRMKQIKTWHASFKKKLSRFGDNIPTTSIISPLTSPRLIVYDMNEFNRSKIQCAECGVIYSNIFDSSTENDATDLVLSDVRKTFVVSCVKKNVVYRKESLFATDLKLKLIKPILVYNWTTAKAAWVWVVEIYKRKNSTADLIATGEYITVLEEHMIIPDVEEIHSTETYDIINPVRKIRRSGGEND